MKYFTFVCLSLWLNIRISSGQTDSLNAIEVFEKQAGYLFKTFQYDSAALYYSKAANLYKQQQDWLYCVKNYRLTSNALLKDEKYDTALYYTRKALSIAETEFHENNNKEMFEKTNVLLNIADINENKGKYNDELAYCRMALELTLKTDSLDSLRIGQTWDKIGMAYWHSEKYSEALHFCIKALNVTTKVLGKEHPDVAGYYYNIGTILLDEGALNEALRYYGEALKIRIALQTEQHLDVAQTYNRIGVTYERKGEYDMALECYQKALKIRVEFLSENHPVMARNYCNIGREYYNKGEYDKALEYLQKSLKINIKVLGKQHPVIASLYDNMGNIYYEQDEYNKALEYLQKALEIHGERHPDGAISYSNIGRTYYRKNEYDKALAFHQKAHNIYIEALIEQHPEIAYTDKSSLQGKYEETLKDFQKIPVMNIPVEQNMYIAFSYSNMGIVFRAKAEYNKALYFFQKALEIRSTLMGKQHPSVAWTYYDIGEIFSKIGDPVKALQNYQRALFANTPAFNDSLIYSNPSLENIFSKPLQILILTEKADELYQLFKKTNSFLDIETSLSTYDLALKLINNMRNKYTVENTKLLLSEQTKKYYAKAAHVATEYEQIAPLKNNTGKAFEFIEKTKSATLAAKFNELKAKHFARIPDSLIEAEKKYESNITFYATEMIKEKYKKGGYDTLKVNLLENKHFSYSRKLDSLISYFETTYPDYYKFKYDNNIVTIQNIQQTIDKNTAIIDYLVGDSSLFIAVLTDSIHKIEEIAIDSLFKASVINYYNNIKTAETEGFVINSNRIYEKLIKPVEKYITHKEHLVIIPDDYLYYIPFETLVENRSTEIVNEDYSKLNYLIKFHSITYHHSATLWYNSKKRETKPVKQNFIGFAPVFSKEKNNGLILSSNINAIDTTGNNLGYSPVSSDLKKFNPLPYSKDEVTSIVRLFEKHRKEAKAYIYTEANESNFKNCISNYRFIHVASHGFSNDKEPYLSGLTFSQPTDSASKEDDGVLYVGETYNLRLNADLIVLSSCESGLGKLIKGEGLQALSRGFLYSGAPNVIFSLWNAEDRTTRDMMIQFYSYVLKKNSYAEALRQVKMNFTSNPVTAFPYFWSEFVLVGR